ncbi:MAG: DegT/DnrJ/EryC1/StrS family aminotransferase [Marinilabiliaceae bacterium]|nr:DegT/DnrJ/EryC1/StrS family aminotransferase [Marinilabiliaceae bacterium]
MLYVTQPSLPPFDEFTEYLKDIWESKWLTNNGKYHQQLERELATFLNVPYISLFSNGTLALITALQTLRITGEVITTPYSFVATSHALNWNGIKPVFCDIESHTFGLNPQKIEALITPQTTAILPVHVYGFPCQHDALEEIADRYGLKLIYDAAHAFGVNEGNQSILNYGDLSILSFHATKAFNTFEGGAIVCHDLKTKQRIDYLKNFGFADEVTVVGPGINAKMNEFQAALGVLQLKYFQQYIKNRKTVFEVYVDEIESISGVELQKPDDHIAWNYSYAPILIDKTRYGKTRDELYNHLKDKGYYARRYFYPLISEFSTYAGLESSKHLPVAKSISEQVLCLPLYDGLLKEQVQEICQLIKDFSTC